MEFAVFTVPAEKVHIAKLQISIDLPCNRWFWEGGLF